MRYKKDKDSLLITPEDEEDLFNLSRIIEKGDIIEGKDHRKIKLGNDIVKKQFFISLEVEEIKLSNPLRIKGKILNENEHITKGSYHSFTVDIGKTFKLIKKYYPSYIFDILNEKRKESIKIVLIDDEKAQFYEVLNKTIKKILEIDFKNKNVSSKEELHSYNYDSVVKLILKNNWDNFILAGPGIFKEELAKSLKNQGIKNFVIVNTSYIGKLGVKELLNRDELRKYFNELRLREEEDLINSFLEKLSKDDKVIYGLNNVKKALEYGAIETLLVNADLLFDPLNYSEIREEILEVIKKAEEQKAVVKLIETEAKKRLKGFGNVVAFLRYNIED